MRRSRGFAFAWLASLWIGSAAIGSGLAGASPTGAPQSGSPDLQIDVRGEPAQPGSVLAVTVTATSGADAVSGEAFGRHVAFVRDGSARVWRGLVGVDLVTTEPSRLLVSADLGGGRTVESTRALRFTTRQFLTRRLRVASQFVDPSPEELERIRLEAARLEAIFATVTATDRLEPIVAPIAGVPGSNFGTRSIFNGEPRAPHAGTDFRGATGTPVAAPGGGRVVLAEDLFFTGQTVVIDHGLGLYSLLAHLSRIDVTAGQTVERNRIVGLLGATGRVTGPHLHWTVRLGGARVDPLRLVALLAPAQSGAISRPEPAGRAK